MGAHTAAELLIIFGDNPDRIRSEAAFAKLCGACPIPASSGMTTGRHRLNRGGHRHANAALYRAVIVRMRFHQPTRDYVARRTADGRTKREIIRCLKRFLAREIYQRVMTDFRTRKPSSRPLKTRVLTYRGVSTFQEDPLHKREPQGESRLEFGMPHAARGTLPLFDPAPVVSERVSDRTAAFVDLVQSFSEFGQPSAEIREGPIRYLINEFWTSGQRQAHSIHEVSYRACFKAQLPEFFIKRLTRPGDAIYDPFMGRGTTPVQAALMGRRPIGNDINPLSVLFCRPRLEPPAITDVARRLDEIRWEKGESDDPDLLAFYSPQTLRHVCALREWLLERAPLDQTPDPVDDWIRMVAINRLSGHSPGFFSVYTLPPNQAVSAKSQRKINERRGQIPPDRNVKKLILRKTASLLHDGPVPSHPPVLLMTGTAQSTPTIQDSSVQLVVTSPPFLDIVQYAEDNWLRSWFAGIDTSSVAIAHHRTEIAWQDMIRETLSELGRIVMAGGHVAFEVGEVRNGKVLLERLVWEAAEDLPFDRLFVMVNQQEFTKTANCWGVRNNTKGTNTNRIVVLRRH